jgi:hypothetical protein
MIPVFLLGQNPASQAPRHRASHLLSSLVISARLGRPVDWGRGGALQLTTRAAWRDVKRRVGRGTPEAPAGLSPADSYHVPPFQSYPPVPAGPNERRLQKQIWMSAERF